MTELLNRKWAHRGADIALEHGLSIRDAQDVQILCDKLVNAVVELTDYRQALEYVRDEVAESAEVDDDRGD